MSGKTITITADGDSVSTSSTGDATVFPVHHHQDFDGGAFTAGLFVGAGVFWLAQRKRRARLADIAAPPAAPDRFESEVAALARRTATLERIVTAPGARVERDIDALR